MDKELRPALEEPHDTYIHWEERFIRSSKRNK